MPLDEPKLRQVIIPIRYPTEGRRRIVIIVSQRQSATGQWLVPIITFEGPLGPFLESGRFVRDVGEAFIVAAYVFDWMMMAVKREYFKDKP